MRVASLFGIGASESGQNLNRENAGYNTFMLDGLGGNVRILKTIQTASQASGEVCTNFQHAIISNIPGGGKMIFSNKFQMELVIAFSHFLFYKKRSEHMNRV